MAPKYKSIEILASDSELDDDNFAEALLPDQSDNAVAKIAPPSPPATITKGRKRKHKEKGEPAATTMKLRYNLAILSAAELKKPVSRQEPKGISFSLSSDEPWDTLKAQLLVKIDGALKPGKISFDDYEIKYYISRLLPKPGLELDSQEQYEDLVDRSRNIKSNPPTINITVRPAIGGSGRDDDKENEEESSGGKTKKKARLDPETLPGNVAKNKNIQLLQEQWKCKRRQDSCVGVYCFPDPETDAHLPLNHERLDCWAAAMLKGEESATVTKPPNHKLFDTKSASLSPVLQRRLDAQNQKNVQAAPPIFNFNIGNEVASLFRPHVPTASAAPAPIAPTHATAPASTATTAADCPFLLSPLRRAGLDMPLDDFGIAYELGEDIVKRFQENCYKKSSALRFVSIQELNDMGFRLGEIAALRVAVEAWSVPLS